jgi:REP element-mobilizing transposase RayT
MDSALYCAAMARPLRIEFPGALYHVTARGDRRDDIYLDDEDRRAFLGLLGQVCQRFDWACHAYCLMTNHYHLLVETRQANLSRGMRQLGGVYTQRFNRRHGQVGHVFQGRYHAILVDKEPHLLELCRYVVLNPVRAGLVTTADQWPWSSFNATLGRARTPDWLESDWLLGQFGRQRSAARAAYADFVAEDAGHGAVWQGLNRQIYLGDDRFVARLHRMIGGAGEDLSEIPRAQRHGAAEPLSYYEARYREPRRAMAEAFASGAYTLKAIGAYFGVHYSTVSRAVRDHEAKGRP